MGLTTSRKFFAFVLEYQFLEEFSNILEIVIVFYIFNTLCVFQTHPHLVFTVLLGLHSSEAPGHHPALLTCGINDLTWTEYKSLTSGKIFNTELYRQMCNFRKVEKRYP